MKPNTNNTKDAGPNQMMISEVKHLKERLKVLEADNKLLRSREVSVTKPVITYESFNQVRNALLNLLVAVENTTVGKTGEMKKALAGAEAIIRPGAAVVQQVASTIINVDRAE